MSNARNRVRAPHEQPLSMVRDAVNSIAMNFPQVQSIMAIVVWDPSVPNTTPNGVWTTPGEVEKTPAFLLSCLQALNKLQMQLTAELDTETKKLVKSTAEQAKTTSREVSGGEGISGQAAKGHDEKEVP